MEVIDSLPRWRSRRAVFAAKVISTQVTDDAKFVIYTLEGGSAVEESMQWASLNSPAFGPVIGGYYVKTAGDHRYWQPAEAFEAENELIE